MKRVRRQPATMVAKANEYLEHRRSLGFELGSSGGVLLDFAAFADETQAGLPLTTDIIVHWATRSERHSSRYRAARLSIVRGFARFLVARGDDGDVPDARILPGDFRRGQPHIYSDEQLRELLRAARSLVPVYALRPHVYEALFGLLASTGLRISEALALRKRDVDLDGSVLRVEKTKFRKSRLVPIHETVARHLRQFAELRAGHRDAGVSECLLVGRGGRPLPYSTVRTTFRRLVAQLGWKSNGTLPRPRIHDLRHTFACRRILQWYHDGIDVDHALASLSTYMGHGKLTDTYWYLSASGALLGIAGERFERFAFGKGPLQ